MEAADAAPGPQHDLLGHVLGLASIAEQPQQHREQAVGMGAGQLLDRVHVARLGPGDQAGLSAWDVRAARPARLRHHASRGGAAGSSSVLTVPLERTRSKIPAGAPRASDRSRAGW